MAKLRSILLIDDDPICTWLNKSFLEDLAVAQQVNCLSEGQLALDYLQEICNARVDESQINPLPDLIFLDLNMPGVDGFEFLDKLSLLKNCNIRLAERVVILTTSMHERDLEKATRFQLVDYVVKPLTHAKIQSIIDKYQQKLPNLLADKEAAQNAALPMRNPIEHPQVSTTKDQISKV